MQKAKTIARPYAVAVWRHAVAQDAQDGPDARDARDPDTRDARDRWSDTLLFMAAVTRDSAFAALIADPRVDAEALNRLMLDICGDRLNAAAAALVKLLNQNGKLALLPQVAEIYGELQAEAGGTLRAAMTAAYAVDAESERAIAAAMRRRFGRKVTFSIAIDADLIGGVVIRAGDMVIDASARGQLQALAAQLRV